MNTAKYVDQMVTQWQQDGMSKAEIVWNAALLCVDWPYVYSAWGAECTPGERRKRYRMCPSHTTIKTKCKGFDDGNCNGCKWYPGQERVRCFDCRGFTDWTLKRVGIDLYGDTCGVQWNHKANWAAQGLIATMPKDRLCCLFVRKDGKYTHTGLGINNEVCDCGNNVTYSKTRPAKWTHWAVPAGLYEGDIPTPTPDPEPTPAGKPMLKCGDRGTYVMLLQTQLINKGYSCGPQGADGNFGTNTEKAVKAFQKEHNGPDGKPLKVDGIVGDATWWALESAPERVTYTVTIQNLTADQKDKIKKEYPAAIVTPED